MVNGHQVFFEHVSSSLRRALHSPQNKIERATTQIYTEGIDAQMAPSCEMVSTLFPALQNQTVPMLSVK